MSTASVYDMQRDGVSIFQPHHLVTIDYPTAELLHQDDNEELALAPIRNSENRFDPTRPLIDDAAVEHHAGRSSIAESKAFYVTHCAGLVDNYRQNKMSWADKGSPTWGPLSDQMRLVIDMSVTHRGNGFTDLEVVTFTRIREGFTGTGWNPDDDGLDHMIRITRRTEFHLDLKSWPEDVSYAEYEMPLHIFEDEIPAVHEWQRVICDLLHGTSDRAVRYVALRLEEQGFDNPEAEWKAPRTPDYESTLDHVTKPTDLAALSSDERFCISCTDALQSENSLALFCSDRHIVCKGCLITWCKTQGPANVSCLYCRNRIFVDPATLEHLKFGSVGKAYEKNQLYNEYENFERSFSDLDKKLAEDDETLVKVQSEVCLHFWDSLVHAAASERIESTPVDLQPVRCPEYKLLDEALKAAVISLDGVTLSASLLYFFVEADIFRAFGRTFLGSIHSSTMANVDWKLELMAGASSSTIHLGLRPGFEEFIQRSVSRVLQYLHVRQCDCDKTQRYHYHGMREHYCAEVEEVETEQHAEAEEKSTFWGGPSLPPPSEDEDEEL